MAAANAVTIEESMPPERKVHTGTSDTICRSTVSRTRKETVCTVWTRNLYVPGRADPRENVVLSVRTEYMIMSRHNFLYACEYAVSGGACRTDRQNFLQTVFVNGWSDIRMTK